MSRSKSKKAKPIIKVPALFHIGAQLWRVEYKWRLTDLGGVKVNGYVDSQARTIFMDRGLPAEEKPMIFMNLVTLAIMDTRILLNEASTLVAMDITEFLFQSFKIRWKRSNETSN